MRFLFRIVVMVVVLGVLTSPNDQFNRLLQYTTNPTRTTTVTELCASFSDRNSLVDSAAQEENALYSQYMDSSFGINGNTLVMNFLNGNSNTGIQTLQGAIPAFVMFVGPFLIGLVIILTIWSCLACCCCCPGSCPSKCCRKNQEEQYTKCQLLWPTITLFVAVALTLIAGITGVAKAGDLESSMNAVSCSLAITFDDLINGNVSTAGTFFIGVRTLERELGVLNSNIDSMGTQLSNVGSGGATIIAANGNATDAKDKIDKIPTGSAGGKVTAFTYGSPFNSGSPGSTVSSLMPDQLGSTNVADAASKVYIAYAQLDVSKSLIDGIASAADTFVGQISTFKSAVGGVQGTVGDFASLLEGFDTTMYEIFTQLGGGMSSVTVAIIALFTIVIVLCALAVVGAVLMTFCQKYKFRYMIYGPCCILFLIGIVGFLIAFLFSLLTPILYFGCQFIQFSIASSANFNQNFGDLLGSNTNYFSVCLSGGTGNLINEIGGDTTSTLTSLQTVISDMNSFNATSLSNDLGTQFTSLKTLMNNYEQVIAFDFSSSSDENILRSVANRSSYSGCSAGTFTSDSWIPTVTGTISCSVGGSGITTTECSTQGHIQASTNGCTGCLDTSSILASVSGSIQSDLQTRYSNAGDCATFASDMANIWTNYYNVKSSSYASISGRITTAETSVNNYKSQIATVGTTFDSVLSNLNSIASSIADPTYGIVAGFNCSIFGENLALVVNTLCARIFNSLYFLRLALGVSAFGILFMMCCSVCTGVRHFKHSQRKEQFVQPDNNNDQTMTLGHLEAKY